MFSYDDNIVSIVRCEKYDVKKIKTSLEKLLDSLGGIRRFISRNDKVLIKPNMLAAHPPEKGVTTHPSLLQALIELVINAGGKPYIADSPAMPNFKLISKKTGIKKIAEKMNITLKEIDKSIEIKNPNGLFKKIELGKDIFEVDKIINLARLKTHNLMTLTLGVKNVFGVVVGRKKAEWHLKAGFNRLFFAQLLIEIYYLVRPHLTIVDGIMAMEGNGPSSGTLRPIGLLFAGKDAVSIDRVISHAIGLKDNLYIIKAAQKYNHPPKNFSEIHIKGIKSLEEIKIKHFELPPNIEKIILSLSLPQTIARKFISRPKIINKNCELCGNCIEVCPTSAIFKIGQNLYINYDKCVNCLCCQEICPHNAIKIKKHFISSFLHWI
jgi:uncharacterized protein (DUF362 family)/NAD-dependent dihydropyrimidine dehydrogenase PreA subunit